LKPHRLAGRRLQRIRADWFDRFPLCEHCRTAKPPRVRLATQLDHIKPLEDGGDDFDCDDEQNRQGLCDDCHAAKTAKDRGYRPLGGDANGFPTDPAHPWNGG
jgi:5-methylcytosine-specific restriction protein A